MTRDVGVGQLVNELEQRGDRLPFEIGAFVALEACEGLLQDSVKLEPDDVRVTLDGAVVVAESAEAAEPDEAARSLVSVLAKLLVAAGPGVPPYLLDLVKTHKTGESERGLRDLHDAIEASLIPINRGASRRVLARLVRESDRPPAPVPPVPDVSPSELDAELDELLRDPVLRTLDVESKPAPEPVRAREPAHVPDPGPEPVLGHEAGGERAHDSGLEAEPEPVTERIRVPHGLRDEPVEAAPSPAAEPAAAAAPALKEPPRQIIEPVTATIRKWQPAEEPEEATATDTAAAADTDTDTDAGTATATAAGTGTGTDTAAATDAPFATATESVFGGGAVATAESIPSPEPLPERPSRATAPPSEAEPTYDRPSLPQKLPKRRGGWGVWLLAAVLGLGGYAAYATGTLDSLLTPARPAGPAAVPGTIQVTVTPADAQIFVFVGRGPTVSDGLAVGTAHEFVVFDQGLTPSRAVVPEGATWATTESGPLYELAVQAKPTEVAEGATNLGAPQTSPGAAAAEAAGTVRVITNPPAAKVYRFVGMGPSAKISVPTVHEGQEVLVYREGYETRRAVIGPSDWQADSSSNEYRASLSVRLPARPPASPATETGED